MHGRQQDGFASQYALYRRKGAAWEGWGAMRNEVTYDRSVDFPIPASPRNRMGTTGVSLISVVGNDMA